jgi:hypothetical protein
MDDAVLEHFLRVIQYAMGELKSMMHAGRIFQESDTAAVQTHLKKQEYDGRQNRASLT